MLNIMILTCLRQFVCVFVIRGLHVCPSNRLAGHLKFGLPTNLGTLSVTPFKQKLAQKW